MALLRRSDSFRRKLKASPAGPSADTPQLRCSVQRLSGNKWLSRFAVLHQHALCLYSSPSDWTSFRSFPSEVIWLDGLETRALETGRDADARGGRLHNVVLELPGVAVVLSFDVPAEAARWAAALSRHAPTAPEAAAAAAAAAQLAHVQRQQIQQRQRQTQQDQLNLDSARQAAAGLQAQLEGLCSQSAECAARVAAAREGARVARAAAALEESAAEAAVAEAADIDDVQLERALHEVGLRKAPRAVGGEDAALSFIDRLRDRLEQQS